MKQLLDKRDKLAGDMARQFNAERMAVILNPLGPLSAEQNGCWLLYSPTLTLYDVADKARHMARDDARGHGGWWDELVSITRVIMAVEQGEDLLIAQLTFGGA